MSSLIGSQGFGGGGKAPSGYKQSSMQKFTPEQMQLFQRMFSNVSPDSYLSRLAGGDEDIFNEMEAPGLRKFSELQGNLASRFSGMGMGARNSSGFQNTMNQASSDFAQDLQSKRQMLQQQAIKDLMGLSGDLLGQSPYEQFLVPKEKKKSFWQQLIGAAAPAAGAGLGFMAGGPSGAMAGGQIGSSFGQAFQ